MGATEITATQLLANADAVVSAGDATLRGVWPRAAAALTRQALETHARTLLSKAGARVEDVRFGALMLATQAVMHPTDARELSQLWSRLSECLHDTELGMALDIPVAVARARALITNPRAVEAIADPADDE